MNWYRKARGNMIYTVGNTNNYMEYFKEQKQPQKAIGGSVWKTREEALRFCKNGFSVFGVMADWDTDTVPNKGGDWHDLLIPANLVII